MGWQNISADADLQYCRNRKYSFTPSVPRESGAVRVLHKLLMPCDVGSCTAAPEPFNPNSNPHLEITLCLIIFLEIQSGELAWNPAGERSALRQLISLVSSEASSLLTFNANASCFSGTG